MANTVIQLKYSNVTNKPPTLNTAEPAYSSISNTLWIDDGVNGVVAIGGKAYTDKIDAATDANTANTIVKRDTNGNVAFNYISGTFTGDVQGNAATATKLLNGRNFEINGLDVESAAVAFDGTAGVVLQGNLKSTGVSAGTYGGASQIPVFSVDSKGRLSYAANVSVATSLGIAGDTGTDTIALATDTLTFVGGDGITSVVNSVGNNVAFSVDNTVIRTTGNQSITGDLSVTGNLNITGNTTQVDVLTLNVSDPLIYLAGNNYTSDIVDIGFVGNYFDGSSQRHAGLIRKHGTDTFYAFTGYEHEPDNNIIDTTDASYKKATIHANFTGGNVSSLFNAIGVSDGGTGAKTFTVGQLLIGNGTGALQGLANSTYTLTGGLGTGNTVTSVTVDDYGRLTGVTGSTISIDAGQIDSGLVEVARGGTNNDTYTTGAITMYDGTKITSLANTGTAGTYGSMSDVPVITTDAYGRVSSVSNTAIEIAASAIKSGTLGVARGGTGASLFAIKGVIISDSSSTTGALSSLTSATEGHVLQINSSGAPTFAHLSGGTF